jgi:hypothetical protein
MRIAITDACINVAGGGSPENDNLIAKSAVIQEAVIFTQLH